MSKNLKLSQTCIVKDRVRIYMAFLFQAEITAVPTGCDASG